MMKEIKNKNEGLAAFDHVIDHTNCIKKKKNKKNFKDRDGLVAGRDPFAVGSLNYSLTKNIL
jgi:hypothetical protein